MAEEDKEAKKIVQSVFERTNVKIGEDDPSVALVLGIRDVLKENLQDFEENVAIINHNHLTEVQGELAHAVANIQMQLDGANEYFVGNSDIHARELQEAFERFLGALDAKNGEMRSVLEQIQSERKASDERFDRCIAQIERLQNAKTQPTVALRDVIVAGVGFAVGVTACLLLM